MKGQDMVHFSPMSNSGHQSTWFHYLNKSAKIVGQILLQEK